MGLHCVEESVDKQNSMLCLKSVNNENEIKLIICVLRAITQTIVRKSVCKKYHKGKTLCEHNFLSRFLF